MNESFDTSRVAAALRKLQQRRQRKATQRKAIIAALLVGGASLALMVRHWQREAVRRNGAT